MIRTISSAVDKLDKMSWDKVKLEMLEKGLDSSVADKIGVYCKMSGGKELCESLEKDSLLINCKKAREGLNELKLLFDYIEAFGVSEKMISFDLSLARGLDYYTGVIYEAVLTTQTNETSGIGSIAAGGRYDDLVGMFSGKRVPCVGISIGVERVYAILTSKKSQIAQKNLVYVCSADGHLLERMKICTLLWENGISADFSQKLDPKLRTQLSHCEKNMIPFAIIIGTNELQNNIVKVKNLETKIETVVDRLNLVSFLKDSMSMGSSFGFSNLKIQ